jgi:hypothetical protein
VVFSGESLPAGAGGRAAPVSEDATCCLQQGYVKKLNKCKFFNLQVEGTDNVHIVERDFGEQNLRRRAVSPSPEPNRRVSPAT